MTFAHTQYMHMYNAFITGVELSDVLSSRMGLLSNGEELSLARRNKYLMGEQVIYVYMFASR